MTTPRRIGVIRVVTSTDLDFLGAHGRILEAELGVTTRTACIPDQPRGVHDDDSFALADRKVPLLAEELAPHVDAIVVSCAADPGLAGARDRVAIPVLGAGASAAGVALTLGERVGVLDLTTTTPASVTRVLGARLHGAIQPDGVTETAHLLTPEGKRSSLDAGRRLVESGADVLLLACTGMTTIGLAEPLRRALGVPVVDAVRTAGLLAASPF
ncbi:hydantoin racemase [Actinosynnema pretiosum subsp. pretiosum]|uniref:Asp/Glu/hydantoin racemase n=2 Tax=Actinosynnema TaxID=40566 RepID=C6WHA5_ACTMD|nr:aspartate/glutamate racemase family protein [Actinosynnema mirum]ACU38024.1 Asp/Glu/hydantoin racemase [Actinosynnema mirum DSM 43827]AXX31516.1 hydantoin racemase [Actinosynnema pretiosum subsp. pretiosum]QUF04448.1 hydantoin racemase [Actinosynnema pretiosum subsp. pretiosum]